MANGWEAWQPVTLESGFDLTTAAGQNSAWNYIERIQPDAMVIQFPCSPWSRLQQMNTTPSQQQRLAEEQQHFLHLQSHGAVTPSIL